MYVIGAMRARLNPFRVLQFAVATALLRIDHALFSTPWHIDGDMGIPWLMANDWDATAHHRFYWGQNYLGTYETAVLAKIGHLIWGSQGTIPVEFNFCLGQLLYVAGATALFAAVRRIKPKFGDRWWEFAAAVFLLGFAVPGMAKFSFSVGTGYSLTPLAVGLTAWLWTKENAINPGKSRPLLYLAIGLFVGLSQTVIRLNLIPAAAVFGCLALTRFRHRWPAGEQWRPWLLFAAGIGLGFLPEVFAGLEHDGPATLAFFPLSDRWHRLAQGLSQSGVALGTLPYATVQPEDALFFRGHSPEFAHDLLDLLSVVLLGALAYVRRADWKSPTLWIFWATVALNVVAVTLSGAYSDLYSARRYEFPMLIALSALILLSLDTWLGRGLACLRVLGLVVYLISSITYASPMKHMRALLTASGFDVDHDCLSGSGGDLTAVQALGSIRYTVISHKWRLAGNYSRAIEPTELEAIRARCRSIYHIDTGETPIEEVASYCPGPRLIYREFEDPVYRARVRLFGC